eukprot:1071895-Ditylum_brightwellii.AAC.1
MTRSHQVLTTRSHQAEGVTELSLPGIKIFTNFGTAQTGPGADPGGCNRARNYKDLCSRKIFKRFGIFAMASISILTIKEVFLL